MQAISKTRTLLTGVALAILILGPSLAQEQLTLDLAVKGKQVLFLGESHDSASDHQGQLEVLRTLATTQDSSIVVVAEMFNETGQRELEKFALADDYHDFSQIFWKEQWGHSFALYRPIFELIKNEKMGLTYLRPDPALTKLVKKDGAMAAVGVIGEILLGPVEYRDHLRDIAQKHLPTDSDQHALSQPMLDRFFLVQCFWDEFMSWRVATVAEQNPKALVVVLVGHGHLYPEFGVVWRLRRRMPEVKTATIGFEPTAEWAPDFIWNTTESPGP